MMQKDLGHLSSEEIEALMQRYYNGEAASRLIKEYKLSVRAAELYKLFPPEVYPNYSCEYCDEFLVINRPSKATKDSHNNSDYLQKARKYGHFTGYKN